MVPVPFIGGDGDAGISGELGIHGLHGVEGAPVNAGGSVQIAGALDMNAVDAGEIRGADGIDRVNVLPDVVGRVVRFAMSAARDEGVHQFPGGEGAGEVVVGGGGTGWHPAFHGAVFIEERYPEVLRIFDDRAEDAGVFVEVFLEALVLAAQFVVVADERADLDVIGVAAEEMRHADEAQDVILVANAVGGIAADEVVIGAEGEAEVGLLAGIEQALGVGGAKGFVVQVGGDVVLAGTVAAEHA